MNIIHILAEPTNLGGAERYALELAAAQATRGDDVAIFHLRPGSEAPRSVTMCELGAGSLPRLLAERNADVVHVHGTPLEDESALAGRRFVRSLHDYSFGCATGEHWFHNGDACGRAHGPGCFAGMLGRGCAHRLDLRDSLRRYREISAQLPSLRDTEATVVYSNAVREAAVANGIASDRVFVVPYFVNRAAEPAPLPATRSLAFVGRTVGAKGLDVALHALARVPDTWHELHVVGDGWGRLGAEQLAATLGLSRRVIFDGWLAPEAVAAVVAGTRALLLPSRWPEPFGIAGLEALAVGRAVIASDTGGIPEWLDSTCGILVRPGDAGALAAAVERLADDAVAAELGRAGWERAARYGVEEHLAGLDAVYRTVSARARVAA